LQHRNGRARGKTKKAADEATLSKGIEPIKAQQIHETLLSQYCKAKPPITPEAVKKCRGSLVRWYEYRCIRLDGRAPIDSPTPTAVVLLRISGKPFPAVGKLPERKTHTTKGSVNSWLASGDVATAETIIDVEGVTDLLAVVSAGLPPSWVAVTSTAGAKARGKLPREWAKGKNIIVAGDADEPGQEGMKRSAAAYHQAGATEALLAQLPYPVEKDHGRDIRDWLLEGHAVVDLPTVPVSAEQAATWAKSGKPEASQEEQLSNAIIETEGEGDKMKTIILPRPMIEVCNLVSERTADELRRVDRALFVHTAGGRLDWLDSAAALFGYLQTRCGIVSWRTGTGFVGKEELFCELQRQAPAYVAVEPLPHWPPISGVYYTCPMPKAGDGRALSELIDLHCLETNLDRELALAMYATATWGGPPGTRPAFLITASGRGKGKTRFAQNFARVFGGQLDISPQEDIGTVKQRLLSPEAAQKRIATLDNVKTARFSWGEFENLITANIINGKKMYVGDANRPNLLTWTITLNGASLSTDMAQRVVEIRLREPDYDAGWEDRVQGFIDTNRHRIIADCIGFLQRPANPMRRYSRWATWEAQVLSQLDHPDDCLSLVLDRRGNVDVEQEESAIIEDYFAHKLTWLGYDPDRDDIFIPNDIAARWHNAATGDKAKVTGATRALKQLHEEGRAHRIVYSRASGGTGRGFRWVGEHADASDVTHYDIRERLAEKLQEQAPNSGAERSW
jgi:hypothetical protein